LWASASGKKKRWKSTTLAKISGEVGFDWDWIDKPVTFLGTAVLTGRIIGGKTTSAITAKLYFELRGDARALPCKEVQIVSHS